MFHLQSDLDVTQLRQRSRSMGIKFMVVCFLALLMTIPSFFVHDIVNERSARAADVVMEISAGVGGRQTFLGPTLAIPYEVPSTNLKEVTVHGIYLVFPTRGEASAKTSTEERHRSLFRVPVFQSDMKFNADFDLTGVPANAPPNAILDWSRAEVIVGAGDARGALSDIVLNVADNSSTLAPSTLTDSLTFDQPNSKTSLVPFGTPAASFAHAGAKFHASAAMRYSGAQSLALLAYGKTTQFNAQGDWRSPGFIGIPPSSRSIYQNGFSAVWTIPFIARGVRAEGPAELALSGLNAAQLGVSFVEVADAYQSVNRSLKYLPLFLGLIFLSYFVFEATTGRRVHPAQYILVGIAQIIFYLLLLSFAERIGFGVAFLIAGGATVGLLSANAGWIFESRAQALRAFACFSLLYSLIYLLLTLEDNALMVGAIASFLAVAAVMYFTRRIDWYSSLSNSVPPPPTPREAA